MGSSSGQQLDLTRLVTLMSAARVRRLYVKRLAPNDNSKNQVYFGQGFEAVNIFPNRGIKPDRSGNRPIFKASLNLSWLDARGTFHAAPHAQLILYPQYPEVRFSGFLKGCKNPPSELMASRTPGRVLVLGVRDDGRIIAYVTGAQTGVARELAALRDLPKEGVFSRLVLGVSGFGIDARGQLLRELGRIHRKGWITSRRLSPDGVILPCNARNCGGFTLEAELGIRPNSSVEPDLLGWELKQHDVADLERPESGGAVTLMTPEPTAGYYKEKGVEAFVRRFGYPDISGRPDRFNFGGIHVAGKRHPRTGLTLTLTGYDPSSGNIISETGGIALLSDRGEEAATWRFADLMEHWRRKHTQAAYVPSMSRRHVELQYRYGPVVRLGEGTDFLHFLRAVAQGRVYYDPGIKLEGASTAKPRTKRRSQFRTKSRDLPTLYDRMTPTPVA